MPEAPARVVNPLPRVVIFFLLLAFVGLQGAMWLMGFLALFQNQLPAAGKWLTYALLLLLVGGWIWRWLVAMGRIGGRPTARFGGAASE